ncbi:hypothetical protein ACQCVH_14910 [Bacillus infantis]|uniref:hypothetical protein n=1 Tax=Bacillus infantis TaxID=324767 RepID=UPI003CF206CA
MLQNMIFINGGISPRIYKIRDEQAPDNQQTYCTGQLEERIDELEHLVQLSDQENESLKRQLCNMQIAYSRLMQQLICQEQFTVSLSPKVLENLFHHSQPVFWEGCSETFKRSIISKMEEGRKKAKSSSGEPVYVPYLRSTDGGMRDKAAKLKSGWDSYMASQNLLAADTENQTISDEAVPCLSNLGIEIKPESELQGSQESSSEGNETESGNLSGEQVELQKSESNSERGNEIEPGNLSVEQVELQISGESNSERGNETEPGNLSDEQVELQKSESNSERGDETEPGNLSDEQVELQKSEESNSERGDETEPDNLSVEQVEKDSVNLTEEKGTGLQYMEKEEADDSVSSEHSPNMEKDQDAEEVSGEPGSPVPYLGKAREPDQEPLVPLLMALPPDYPVAFVHTEGTIIQVLRFAGLDEPNRSANFVTDKGLVSIPYTHINGIVFR